MKSRVWIFLAIALVGISAKGYSYDRTGMLNLNYTVGPSFIAGGGGATDVSSVEPGVGAGLQFGLTSNVDLKMDYDYIDADLRTQALTFGAQWRFRPGSAWGPFAGAGMGFGKPYSGEGWDHFSLKLTGGLEKEITTDISLVPVISYQYVQGPGPFGSVHAITPGIKLVYYFATLRR